MFRSPRVVQTIDTKFWVYHLWLPLLFLVPTLYLLETTSLDVSLADLLYQAQGGDWALRKHWLTYGIMHHWGKKFVILIGLVMLALYAASWKVDRLSQWRWSLAFAFIAMVLLPSLIAYLKQVSGVPCPWEISRYGGDLAYMHNFDYMISARSGHCFPAGHSSCGFGLLAIYFAFLPFVTKRIRLWLLLPGLVTGSAFGAAQQLRGAHFISHDLWSVTVVWFGILLLLNFAWILKSSQD